MELSLTLLLQVVIMFLMIAVGFLCNKIGMISPETNRQMSNLLLLVVNPALLIVSFQQDYQEELVHGLLWAVLLAFITHIAGILISTLLIRKREGDDWKIERVASVYSNCGFMSTPLVFALFGTEGVFYLTAYMLVFNLLLWTHGCYTFRKEKIYKNILSAFRSVVVLAVLLGLVLFFLRIKLPGVIYDALDFIGSMNTPLAMLVAGGFIAQTNLRKVVAKPRIYYVSAIRLLIIPLLLIPVFKLMPVSDTVASTMLIASSAPCATAVMMFAVRYRSDELYASEFFGVSTLLSVATMPAILFLYQLLPL